MANHKSSEKRVRQTKKKTIQNKMRSSEAKTVVKKLRAAIATNNKEEALKLLPLAQSKLAKLAQKGTIKKGNASRKTSRLAEQIKTL